MRLGIAVVLGLWASVGCIQSGLVECDDGTACPREYVCAPINGCLSPAQLAACAGLSDGAACSDAVLGNGTCSEGGCIIPRCGDGIRQPGEVCDDHNTVSGDGCSGACNSDESCGNGTTELDEECDCGTPDAPGAERCNATYNGGTICSLTCKVVRCGNGILEPGEVCDDGNTVARDGCSMDCASDETCGNGILDYAIGEPCDDGGHREADGCSSTCRNEALGWRPLIQNEIPAERNRAAFAYDSARRVMVMFAGVGGSLQSDTWEYDGTTWVHVVPSVSPLQRAGAMMAYDAKRQRMVLFGGEELNLDTILGDTWEYDGVRWTRQTPAASPPARYGGSMVYDPGRGRLVMFGGTDGTDRNDTWEYDGNTWTEVAVATRPSTREYASMTYDPARGRVVLYGGIDFVNLAVLNDLWEYDGTTWTQRTTTNTPSPRVAPGVVYDAATGRVVLFGGFDLTTLFDETWELDTATATWTHVTPATTPPPRVLTQMAYDSDRRRVVMFSGQENTENPDTWEYDGTNWTAWSPKPNPPSSNVVGLAYDSARGRVVRFGGYYFNMEQRETWELDGSAWRLRAPATSPPGRYSAAMTYDAARNRTILFGGEDAYGTLLTDTWEYDGTTWTQAAPTTSPPARRDPGVAYDAARRVIVVFGGTGATSNLADTWEYNGTTWTERTPAVSPPARTSAAMSYDTRRGRIVLFGGIDQSTNLDDTWEYDGSTWVLRSIAISPLARHGAAMAYDPEDGKVVMFGGQGDYDLGDVWQYDGTIWTERTTLGSPSARSGGAMTFDASRGRFVFFGGTGADYPLDNMTWTLGYTPFRPREACYSGADFDGDGRVGCTDEDCWAICTPQCPFGTPIASCPQAPACGDGACDPLEDCRSCPADCAAGTASCPIICGDLHCDTPTETAATCPGDCS